MEFPIACRLVLRSAYRGVKLACYHTNQNYSSKSRLFIKFFITSSVFPAGYFIFRLSGLKALTQDDKAKQNSASNITSSSVAETESSSKQTSDIQSIEGEDISDESDAWTIAVKARFESFASLEYNGEVFMTPLDLLEACVEMEPLYVRDTRKKLTKRELLTLLERTPSKSKCSAHLLRDIGERGLFSYSDFLFILQLVSSTTGSRRAVRVAFNMLDVNGDHTIDKKEFSVLSYLLHLAGQQRRVRAGRRAAAAAAKREKESISNFWVIKLLRRFYRKEMAPSIQSALSRVGLAESAPVATEAAAADDSSAAAEETETASGGDKKASDEKEAPAGNAIAALAEAAQAAALISPSVDTTLAVHFFGRNGRNIVTEQDFFTFIKNLQEEILECEFLKFASLSERGELAEKLSTKLYYENPNTHRLRTKGNHSRSNAASWLHSLLPWHWLDSKPEPDNRPVLSGYDDARGEEPDMSVWQAAQMMLRYSEYADTIAALRTADQEQHQLQQEATEDAGAKEKEVTRKKHLLQMVASLGVGAKDSTLEHFIAVQDTLKNIKERVTLSDMRSFMTLLCSLDDFEAAVALHILTGQQFNRTEFERAVYAATGERLAKPLVELVFVLFDLDGDGQLSREEFLSVLHDRLHSSETHATGSKQSHEEQNEKKSPYDLSLMADNFKKCMRREVTKNT